MCNLREFYYVIADGIAAAEEIPEDSGVIVATGSELITVRPSPLREVTLRIDQWVALARARCERIDIEPAQLQLGDTSFCDERR